MVEILICVNRSLRGDMPSCAGRGSVAIADALVEGIAARELDHVELERIRCFGQCAKGPNLRAVGSTFHHGVTLDDVPRLLDWMASLKPAD